MDEVPGNAAAHAIRVSSQRKADWLAELSLIDEYFTPLQTAFMAANFVNRTCSGRISFCQNFPISPCLLGGKRISLT